MAAFCAFLLSACTVVWQETPQDSGETTATAASQVPTGDKAFLDWFTAEVPFIRERIAANGFSALLPEETVLLPSGEAGRIVCLGSNTDEVFTREMIFAVTESGKIFELDVAFDQWHIMHPIQRFMAYVRLGGSENEIAADEVLWVDDSSAPNGYRIENTAENWAVYPLANHCIINLWQADEEGGLMLRRESLADFRQALASGWREGILLAQITVSGNIAEELTEVYTP